MGILILIFLLGLAFGSFTNVLILRLHAKEKGILAGRSHCPHCRKNLEWRDLIPVLSWIFLRGKCRFCHRKISVQYPLVELGMGFLWLLVAWFLGINGMNTPNEWLQFIFTLILVSGLFIITVYDLKYYEIPDEISLPLIAILLATLPFSFTPHWTNALLGAAIPLGFFGLQILISQGKWVGGGDLRLGAIMGLALGWQKTLLALFLAYLLGAVVGLFLMAIGQKKLTSKMPFGPFLAVAIFIGLFWGEELLQWYLQLVGF